MDHQTDKNGLIIYMKNIATDKSAITDCQSPKAIYVPPGTDLFIPGGTHMHHSFGKHCSRNALGFSNMLSGGIRSNDA